MTGSQETVNKALVKKIVDAYSHSDIAPLYETADDTIVWTSHGPAQLSRFGGRHEGRMNALAALSAIAAENAMHRYDIIEMVAEGEVVWLRGNIEVTDRQSGIRFSFEIASRWQFRGGRLIACTEFYDSASNFIRTGRLAVRE
jgi:ketosteroid isomerase-like protein